MTLSTLLIALALMLVLEGLGPFLFPKRWQALMQKLAQEDAQAIRQIGLALILCGIGLLWLFS
ncbi:DUF2065 domain-containing protein [Thalassotalea mangrovi]|uniref:DUF2065 domain-containing protein n=1 Tax=Thalassotalea mangrovi TaxID=2572245 RepID=A0A4U1B7U9_9GAMM|nr:DUF2065 domain-containing protein [Thalassotalea mangrovi]TKB46700.1 DUF2065 domain-containing protein [Thalassotalea mangrovi]